MLEKGKAALIIFSTPFGSLCPGVCLGMQVAVIEFARSVLGWKDAHSFEFNPSTSHPVVIEMPEHNTGQMGATMRLGRRKTVFTSKDSLLSKSVTASHNGMYNVALTIAGSSREGGNQTCILFSTSQSCADILCVEIWRGAPKYIHWVGGGVDIEFVTVDGESASSLLFVCLFSLIS